MSALLAVPDSFRPRASTTGADLFSILRGARSHDKISRSRTLPKNSSGGAKAENRSIVTFLQETMSRRKSPERDSYEAAMARLDEEISRIRSDLSSLRTEGKTMEQRVAGVTVTVEQMVDKHQPVASNNRLSLGAIAESDCESLEEEEEVEEEETEVEPNRLRSKFYRSTASLPCSHRDSGIGTDPAFEMTDPEKYCLLNNFIYPSSNQKKTRSTTAIDFIKNDLHEDSGRRLKATSFDRLSCVSDSALTTFAVRRHIL